MKKTYLIAAGFFAVAMNAGFAQDPGFREAESRRVANRQGGQQQANNNNNTQAQSGDDTAAAAARINSMAALDDTRPLRIGDRVSLRIVEDRDKVLSLYVQDSGDINAPFLNLVKAAGKTCKEVAYYMKKELEKQYFQQATVIIALEQARLERRSQLDDMEYITIYGQVARQGRYELAPEEDLTVSQAVLRAGGLSQFANKKEVKLIRTYPGGKRMNFIIDLDGIMRRGRLQFDVPIRPNDVIIVDEKLVNF